MRAFFCEGGACHGLHLLRVGEGGEILSGCLELSTPEPTLDRNTGTGGDERTDAGLVRREVSHKAVPDEMRVAREAGFTVRRASDLPAGKCSLFRRREIFALVRAAEDAERRAVLKPRGNGAGEPICRAG